MGSIPWRSIEGRKPRIASLSRARLIMLCMVLAGLLCLKSSITTVVVDGPSMRPTLQSGQYLFVSRLETMPRPGDVVVVENWMNAQPMVKRVYKVGGQSVEWQKAPLYLSPEERVHYVVPKGSVYLLGDNSSNSEDSRFYGAVPVEHVIGTVLGQPNHPQLR